MNIVIIDDEKHSREGLKSMLTEHENIHIIGEFQNGLEASKKLRSLNPDVVFTDIKMPGIEGIELVKKLSSLQGTIFIFITAFSEYAVDAFEEGAADYLLKPITPTRLKTTIQRVEEIQKTRSSAKLGTKIQSIFTTPDEEVTISKNRGLERLTVKENGKISFVKPEEVEYFEASGNYVALHVSGKTHLIHQTLTSMEGRLDNAKFLRIHRRIIVNIDQILELEPYPNGEFIVIMNSGEKLKLSRSHREQALEVLINN